MTKCENIAFHTVIHDLVLQILYFKIKESKKERVVVLSRNKLLNRGTFKEGYRDTVSRESKPTRASAYSKLARYLLSRVTACHGIELCD